MPTCAPSGCDSERERSCTLTLRSLGAGVAWIWRHAGEGYCDRGAFAPRPSPGAGLCTLNEAAAAAVATPRTRTACTAEQSTCTSVAAYCAPLAEFGVRLLADLCCGIGGDATPALDSARWTRAVTMPTRGALGLAEPENRCADVTASTPTTTRPAWRLTPRRTPAPPHIEAARTARHHPVPEEAGIRTM